MYQQNSPSVHEISILMKKSAFSAHPNNHPSLWRLTQNDVCGPIKPKMRIPFAAQSSIYTARKINKTLPCYIPHTVRCKRKYQSTMKRHFLVILRRVINFKVLVFVHL